MGQIDLKGTIIQDLDQVDEDMLRIFRAMLDTYLDVQNKKGDPYPKDYDIEGNPLDRDVIIEEMEEINDSIEAGKEEDIPLEKVQERIGKWLETSK